MEVKVTANYGRFKFPAGKFWFGDPCYLTDNHNEVHEDMWSDFCNQMFGGGNNSTDESDCGLLVVDGLKPVFYASTAHGDGEYFASAFGNHKRCGVDAGMLSVVPWEVVEHFHRGRSKEDFDFFVSLGMVFETDSDEMFEVDLQSKNWEGGVYCVTDGSDQDEDEDDSDYDTDDAENYNMDDEDNMNSED